jgi:hypothetical protein
MCKQRSTYLLLAILKISFAGFVFAQDIPGGATLGEETRSIERSYDEQLERLRNEITGLEFQSRQCATAESRARMDSKQQKGAETSAAVQGSLAGIGQGLGPTAGTFLANRFGLNDEIRQRAIADRDAVLREIRQSGGQFVAPRGEKATRVTINAPAVKRGFCKDECQPKPASTSTASVDLRVARLECKECVNEQEAKAKEYSEALAAANKDLKDIDAVDRDKLGPLASGIASTVGLGISLSGAHSNSKNRNKIAAMDRKTCEEQLKIQTDQTKKQLARIENLKSQDLLSAQLRDAARRRNLGNPPPEETNNAGPGIPIGQAQNFAAAKPDFSTPDSGAGGGGGGGGAAGGGGGGDTKGVAWTFGGGGEGTPGGGGLPQQPESANFAAEGGGGGGGGAGGFGDALAGLGEDPGLGGEGLGEEDRGLASDGSEMMLGDGGILSLLARARARYGAHAGELSRSIDIEKLSSESSKEKKETKAPASLL